MGMNSYEALKGLLFDKLQQLSQPLEEGAIEAQIQALKTQIELLTSALGFEKGLTTLSPSLSGVLVLPDPSNWERMQAELETVFDVRMNDGFLIQGANDKGRDKEWWTNGSENRADSYYWDRYSKELLRILNKQVRHKVDESTDVIMNNIGNPQETDFERRGMVVGHVQSGKTGNYSSLICKAADAGYRFIVVIAGDKNNLRNQTQKRLNEHFVGWDGQRQVGVGIGQDSRNKRPISLTGPEKDFKRDYADSASHSITFDSVKVPILMVIKKNTRTLHNVTTWLRKQYKNGISEHAMLLIDDESDYASINTKNEDSPTRINEGIRELLNLFEKRSYVAYTATPYANILIDHEASTEALGEDLFPKDFIYLLDAPGNYFGARKLFIENPNQHVVVVDDYADVYPRKHKKDLEIEALPPSLEEAIRLFLINVSIRDLRGYSSSHNSMMIHATRFTNVHQATKFHVAEYLAQLRGEVRAYGLLPNSEQYSSGIADLRDTYENHFDGEEFSWSKVLEQLTSIIATVVVHEVHQRVPSHLRLQYGDSERTNTIVIGGASISRGFTLEGLSVSYFLRNSIYYDTLMQMGRWFGYRIGYQDLCKVFLPRAVKDSFIDIIDSTSELFEDFRQMSDDDMTPEEFGLAIRYRPESALQVTARNKQRNAEDLVVEMRLDDHTKETARLYVDKSANRNNSEKIRLLLAKLGPYDKPVGTTYLWQNIAKEHVLALIADYNFVKLGQYTLNMRMPVDFIRQYILDAETNWDVALYSGTGKDVNGLPKGITIRHELRKIESFKPSDEYYEVRRRQVSSGNAERVVLTEEEIEEIRDAGKAGSRKASREKMKRPLLMLHFLELNDEGVDKKRTFPAIGFSFPKNPPGTGHWSSSEPIRLKINQVYVQQLREEWQSEEESDD